MVQLQTSQTTVYGLYKRVENPDEDVDISEVIEISSDFQRGDEDTGIWNLSYKQDYINSLEKNYPTGLISVVKPHLGNHIVCRSKTYKVLDGGNRVRSIRDFINNRFAVDGRFFSKDPCIGIERQMSLKHMCIAFQTITIERDDPPPTIANMFARLNTSSVPLKPGELIKSHGWLKNKTIIEMAKSFIGEWDTSYKSHIIPRIQTNWVNVFCKGDKTKLKEGKRCDSLAMMCAFIVSSITSDFKTFETKYDTIKHHLDTELTDEHIVKINSKFSTFLDIMKCVYTSDIFPVTNGIPSRKMIAPVWYAICNESMTSEFQHKMINFFTRLRTDSELREKYISIRDSGSNGEAHSGKVCLIISLINDY